MIVLKPQELGKQRGLWEAPEATEEGGQGEDVEKLETGLAIVY